jgi:hypothetical protein
VEREQEVCPVSEYQKRLDAANKELVEAYMMYHKLRERLEPASTVGIQRAMEGVAMAEAEFRFNKTLEEMRKAIGK